MRLMNRFVVITMAVIMSSVCFSATYPSKTIRLVVPFGAGGGTDAVGRALADSLKDILNTDVLVMNRIGGAGAFGMSYGATQRADGYTLTMITRELVSLPQMGLMKHDSSDFKLVRMVNLDPAIVLVGSDSAFNSIRDLIAEAKKENSHIEFASTAAPNFYLMALEKDQDIKLDAIPYNGSSEAIPALLKNHADVTMVTPGEAINHIKSGKLKSLGVMSESRINSLPDIPTLKEQGVNVVTGTWRGVAVPKDTPEEIVEALGLALDQAMATSKFKSLMQHGEMTIHPMTAEAFKVFVEKDKKALDSLIN